MIGVAPGKEILENLVAQQAIGVVVALALLILDDAALVIELFLRHRAEQMPHAVAFEEQREVERAGRHSPAILGAVEEGRAVEIGRADMTQRLEEIRWGVFGTVKPQMLEPKCGRA